MSKTYRLGALGFAHGHIFGLMRSFSQLPNVEWAACADTVPAVPSKLNRTERSIARAQDVTGGIPNVHLPGQENGKWGFYGYSERTLDRDKFDEFKTRFYRLQGWDTATGYPTRAALEPLGLGYVADELAANGKLGNEQVGT